MTEAISIKSPPARVLDLIGDPEQLPRWAPGFARSVRPDGEHWIVVNDAGQRRVRIRVDRELGIVDFLSRESVRGGYSRVLLSGEGSEMLFTVVFAPGSTAEEREAQRAVIIEELATVRDLVEAA